MSTDHTPTLLKIDSHTGDVTFTAGEGGPLPLPPGWRWIAPIDSFHYGYAITDARGGVLERHSAPMAQGTPRPQPPGGRYTRFGQLGACELLTVEFCSINEPGFRMRFEAYGKHNRKAVERLLKAAIDHIRTPDGQRDFIHPVVTIRPSGYLYEHCGIVRFAHFDVVDWLHADGARLCSKDTNR